MAKLSLVFQHEPLEAVASGGDVERVVPPADTGGGLPLMVGEARGGQRAQGRGGDRQLHPALGDGRRRQSPAALRQQAVCCGDSAGRLVARRAGGEGARGHQRHQCLVPVPHR